MKYFKTAVCLYLLIIVSCRKYDPQRRIEINASNSAHSTFFKKYGTSEHRISRIINWVQDQEQQFHFVDKFISHIGYPVWNKAIAFTPPISAESDEISDVTYIPFVRDSQSFVNAVLIFKTKGPDTTFKLLYDWQYSDYGFSETADTVWNARSVFHIFTNLDKQVFGTTKFRIIDNSLITVQDATLIRNLGKTFEEVGVIYRMLPNDNRSEMWELTEYVQNMKRV